MRFVIGLFLTAVLISGLPGQAALTLTPNGATPPISRAQAVQRALSITGLPAQSLVRAEYGLGTDTTIPFVNVKERPVWLLTFSGAKVTVANNGKPQVNTHLSGLTVLLDARSGALLRAETIIQADRVFVNRKGDTLRLLSPDPRPRGLHLIDRREIEHFSTGDERLMPTAAKPALPLLKALSRAGLTKNTTQVQAYFGLYTDTRFAENPIRQRPAWVLVFDGQILHPSGPPGSDHTPLSAEQMEILDARTGEDIGCTSQAAALYRAFILDETIDTDNPNKAQVTIDLYNGSDRALVITGAQIGDKNRNNMTSVEMAPISPILPGMPGEVRLTFDMALSHAASYLNLYGANGDFISNIPLPTLPRRITCTGIERLDPHTVRITLESIREDLSFATIDVLPVYTKIENVAFGPVPKMSPGQPLRITLTLASPPAPGAPLWLALKDGQNRLVASCLVAMPPVDANQQQ